ncbi:DUF1214 domain-containing protein [Agrobacterium pusense]|uniref:DUF1214 domain-containing protein n=1 Tax=Agrobacterium pusense TaxID=648995 RepID=UPI0028AA13B6|nr:DUF1214 domain-containing protein [Agrobacterium pusense]
MKFSRRTGLKMLAALSALGVTGVSGFAETDARKPSDETIRDAYVYLLGRVLVLRQEQIDRGGDGFAYNQIKYNPLGSADFVNPNFDVAYLEAWIAVDERTPVILEVPEITGRYYTAQILDEWGEVITNINERTFPSMPFGKFALVPPGWQGILPPDTARIELHSHKAKMLGRVELRGEPEGALKLQREFKATAMGNPVIAPPPFVPMFDNRSLIGAEIFYNAETKLSSAFDVSPVAASMQQQVRVVANYVASSAEARASVDKLLREKVIPQFIEYAFTKSAPYRNHWVGGGQTGNYGSNYSLRTVVNFAGIWANTSDEVIYFVASRDVTEKPLDGSKSYVIHFPADELPDLVVDAYWSVILVGVPDYRVVANDLKRYNFNSYSDLKKEKDGSLKIAIGPHPVRGIPESNCLPSPEGKPFSLTFRTYVPKEAVRHGDWAPSAVTQFNQ